MTIMTRSGARFWWKTELPKHVIYMYRDSLGNPDAEWNEYTTADRNAEKKKKQEANITRKYYCLRRVPCYIHVFRLNTDFFFAGYYAMIISRYGKWYLNWRPSYPEKNYFQRVKQHFNFGLLPFDNDNTWFEEFCKAYPMKPKGIQNPRGKLLTHCFIDSNNKLIDIELEGI